MTRKLSCLHASIRRQALLMVICGGLSVAHAQAPSAPQPGSPEAGEPAGIFGDGKRVALVIGQSNYNEAPLPSATVDVAMMAQQLTAAGFHVISGGDLPETGIAEFVGQFVDQLTLKGSESVGFVYISGRFAQINGENWLLPAGVQITRATDATLKGFSVRKLISTLESVPSKTRLVVLDAGPAPPSLKKEPTFSPGLAIMQPPEGFLISFSQGPNRDLVDPVSQPGNFSKALFESILQPTGDIADVFKNIRLRVHTETNGLQVPWEASKLKGQAFAFYPLAGAVANAPPLMTSIGSVAEVRALSRDDAYKQVVATDSITSYQAFMEAYPEDDAVPSMQYTLAVRREAEVWDRATRSNSSDAYWTYISTYPDGGNVGVARDRLAALGYGASPPRGFSPVGFADLPPPLPGREIIASGASMPIELAPRAPRINIPPVPAMVAVTAAAAVAAVALPAVMNRGGGRQLPPVAQAAVRPAWVPPAPASALSPTPAAVPGGAARAPSAMQPGPMAAPGQAPSAAARPAAPPVASPTAVAPVPTTAAPAARPLGAPPAGAPAAPGQQTATPAPQPGAPGTAAAAPAVRPLGAPPMGAPAAPGQQTASPVAQPGAPGNAAAAPAVRPLGAPMPGPATSASPAPVAPVVRPLGAPMPGAPGAPNQQMANPAAQPGAGARPLTGAVSGGTPSNPGAPASAGVRPLGPIGAPPQAVGVMPARTQPLTAPTATATPNFGAAPTRPITGPQQTAPPAMQRTQAPQAQPMVNQRAAAPQVARPMPVQQAPRQVVQQPVRAPATSCTPQQRQARQC